MDTIKKAACKERIKEKVENDLKSEKEFIESIESNPTLKENKCILETICKINEILNDIIKYVNSDSVKPEVTPYSLDDNKQPVLIGKLKSEKEMKGFVIVRGIDELDDESLDLSSMSINDVRNYLYKEVYDIEPIPIPENIKNYNVGAALVGGINIYAMKDDVNLNETNYFMNMQDYKNWEVDRMFIENGIVHGVEIPKYKNVKSL